MESLWQRAVCAVGLRRSGHQEPDDELEAERVFKKARTSSDGPEEATAEPWAGQQEVDKLDTLWYGCFPQSFVPTL